MFEFEQQANYPDIQLPPEARKTYRIVSPLATHFKDATCEQAGCSQQEHGWQTVIDERADLGQRQAHYIRAQSGRAFTEVGQSNGWTAFVFGPGQKCFAAHKVPLDRPEIYLVQAGDHRGNPRKEAPLRHSGPDAWVDDFASHQQDLADIQRRG